MFFVTRGAAFKENRSSYYLFGRYLEENRVNVDTYSVARGAA